MKFDISNDLLEQIYKEDVVHLNFATINKKKLVTVNWEIHKLPATTF